MVVSFAPTARSHVEAICRAHAVPLTMLGSVDGDALDPRAARVPVAELAWRMAPRSIPLSAPTEALLTGARKPGRAVVGGRSHGKRTQKAAQCRDHRARRPRQDHVGRCDASPDGRLPIQ